MKDFSEENNVYCYDIRGDVKHISDVPSGRKGYYCLGCERELQAVKSSLANRVSYFRHDPTGVKHEEKCTYRDETYRHKIAKEILQRLKRIKVPALYKFPQKGEEGLANLLDQPKFIEADRVENELTFYEDAEGNICWGRNPVIDERYLLVKPDVSFFDANGNPILLIEIIATHKITDDKLIKLKRLGINTVQVKVPKDSPQNIEASFRSTEYIKWVYNNVEENTIYIPVSESSSKGILSADELQRKLFEESFNCRAAQIRSLIRSIERCLESKPYRDIETGLRSELSRVKENTERNQSRLDQLREDLRAGVYRKFEQGFSDVESRISDTRKHQQQLAKRNQDLERRYRSKKEELEREERILELRIKGEIKSLGGDGESFEEQEAAIDRDRERILGNIESEKVRIEEISRQREGVPERIEQLKRSAQEGFEYSADRERSEISSIEAEERALPEYFDEKEGDLRREFEELRAQAYRRVKERAGGGDSELSRSIERLLEARRNLQHFKSDFVAFKRIRAAHECFKTRAYKNWKD